jgi:hypothetical protein
MPQFEFLTASVQWAWAVTAFFLFYLLVLKFALPSVFSVLRTREKLFLAVSANKTKVKASKIISEILARIYKK